MPVKYLLDYLEQHRLGPAEPAIYPAGYLPAGNLLAWVCVCVLEELYPILVAPKVCACSVVHL